LTSGVFDPTVQPLWQCYAEHFTTEGRGANGPDSRDIEKALRLVGWPKVRFDRDRIVFECRDMALTLNGVAQGYITDRVIDLLRRAGIDNCLVDMGEIRTLGLHPDGRPWEVVLKGLAGDLLQPTIMDIVNKAVATSGADGFQFNKDGRCNHLFNPATGRCADPTRSMTVVTHTASAADALSTAFALMDQNGITNALARFGNTQVYATTVHGTQEITAGKC
jgi:thiamine biosynthesis lipoprotein